MNLVQWSRYKVKLALFRSNPHCLSPASPNSDPLHTMGVEQLVTSWCSKITLFLSPLPLKLPLCKCQDLNRLNP